MTYIFLTITFWFKMPLMAQYNSINEYKNLKRIEYYLLKFNFKFPHNINFVVFFTNI